MLERNDFRDYTAMPIQKSVRRFCVISNAWNLRPHRYYWVAMQTGPKPAFSGTNMLAGGKEWRFTVSSRYAAQGFSRLLMFP